MGNPRFNGMKIDQEDDNGGGPATGNNSSAKLG
jgi:hypothetical protein